MIEKLNLKKIWWKLILLAAAIIIPACITNSYIISILFMTVLYALLASGWNILSGFTGQMGLGNGLYFSLGAYVTGSLFVYYNVNTWLALLITGIAVALFSILLGLLCFPLKGTYYGLATIALLNILRVIFYDNEYILGMRFGGGPGIKVTWRGGFANMQFVDKHYYYYIVLGLLVLTLVFCEILLRKKTGFYFRAISTNDVAASTLGINVIKYKCIAQCMSAFVLALGGGVYTMYIMYIEPETMFSMDYCLYILIMAMVGGLGEIYGPLLGALILMPMFEIIRGTLGSKLPGIAAVFFGLLLMVCMQFFPKGIIPTVRKFVERRKAVKNGTNREKAVTDK